jgi:16S rRNA (uracil1498-N3)-methyltransferase
MFVPRPARAEGVVVPDRFFHPGPLTGPEIVLDEAEAHHALRVLRAAEGDLLEVFDGAGTAVRGAVVSVGRREVRIRIDERLPAARHPGPALVVGTAIPKGDRFRGLVEKLTELGATRLVPLRTARTVVEPGEGKLDKLTQTVVAACKQCGRNTLLEIDPPRAWADFVAREFPGRTALVADPSGVPLAGAWQQTAACDTVVVAIGPEGGFTADELRLAEESGARRVGLGPFVLRIETAAVALVAAVRLLGIPSRGLRDG